ncbi:MAG: hypothetical protein GXP16_03575 [Gammaproteobacteria bacterium]|nr:hypothetical protein [Gammaproteobacteria bacterium]
MAYLITAHSTQPGKEDLYEDFLKQRKLWFVRNLPGMTSYKVYRTERRFDPSGTASQDIRYTIMAIIEHEGDIDALTALYTSDAWIEFMGEYIHLLEDDPALYVAHEIPEIAHLSGDEFVARGTTEQVA